MKPRALSALLLAAITLTLSGCIAGFTYTVPPAVPHTPQVYINSLVTSSPLVTEITSYPLSANGVTAPISTLTSASGISFIGPASDGSGNLFVGSNNSGTSTYVIDEFGTPLSQTSVPLNSVNVNPITDIAVDDSDDVTIAAGGGPVTDQYTFYSSGPPAGRNSGVTPTSVPVANIAMDPDGNLYAATNQGPPEIFFFPAFNRNPSRTIIPATPLNAITSLAADSSDNVYVTTTGSTTITVFSSTAASGAVPSKTITPVGSFSATSPRVALDSAGNIYLRVGSTVSQILVFPPTASGSVAPQSVITTAVPAPNSTYNGLAVY